MKGSIEVFFEILLDCLDFTGGPVYNCVVLSNIPSTRQLGPPLRLRLAFSLSGGSCCPSGTGTSAVNLWPVYML